MTGEELRALREKRGLTQAEMAAWVNERTGRKYDKQKISRWETGAERVTRDVAILLQVSELERPKEPAGRRAIAMAVALQKGGTGKTVSSINVAYLLARAGNRVLLVDADPQSNATVHVGVDRAAIVARARGGQTLTDVLVHDKPLGDIIMPTGIPGLDLVPSAVSLANADGALQSIDPNGPSTILVDRLDQVRGDYDYIIADCAPNLGLVTLNVLNSVDLVLIPCQTEPHAIYGVELIQQTITRIQSRTNPALRVLGILPTMFNARLTQDRASLEDIRRGFGTAMRVFSPVPRSTVYPQAAGAAEVTLAVVPDAPGLDAYLEVASALIRERDGTASRSATPATPAETTHG